MRVDWPVPGMKDASVIETPLIGSGSQEEADKRVGILLDLGTSRGFLTYEELNEKLPDEVVSPDKLDSLLMMIDEMGIRLIDEMDVHEFQTKPRARRSQKSAVIVAAVATVVTTTKSSRNLTPAVAIPPGKDESESIDED